MSGFDRVIFIYGAGGVMGRAYMDFFSQDKANYCIGFTQNDDTPSPTENSKYLKLGISPLNTFNFLSAQNSIPLDPRSPVREVVMVYAVGPSKFEPPEKVGTNPERGPFARHIDERIYTLNLSTFRDLTFLLFNFAKSKAMKEMPIHLKLVGFASIADKYEPDFWYSYTRAKKLLRRYIRRAVTHFGDDPDVQISGVIVNVATVDTPNERALRPGVSAAERGHWLKPQQVVEESKNQILSAKPGTYSETDIFNPWAGFSPDLYHDVPASRARWEHQLQSAKM